jgi:hypothetical protein
MLRRHHSRSAPIAILDVAIEGLWLFKPRRICEECTRGEFAAEKRCGEFATLRFAMLALRRIGPQILMLEFPPDGVRQIHRGAKLANSPAAEGREFPAAQRLQILRP